MPAFTKAPIGQRLAAAFIALFCMLFAAWLSSGVTWATWYIAALAVLVLCVAFVFGHVAFRGMLPGGFLAGGNVFVGGGRSARIAGAYSSAPMWQRTLCAVLAIGGAIAIGAGLTTGGLHSLHHDAASLVLALGGTYQFGHVALRGRLPWPYASGGNTSLYFRNRRGGG
jgi:hypothetical protein